MAKMTGFKVYKGTKQAFIESGKATANANAIVFITGGSDATKSCIFAQGTYFANFTEFIATYVGAMNYVKGINVGGQSYNASAGGGYVAFNAKDPSTVAVNANSNGVEIGLTDAFINKVNNTAANLGTASDNADKDGSVYARIANLATLVSNLTGDSTDSIEGQITSAITALRTEIVGTLDTADAKTLAAINDELDGLDAKVKTIADDYLKAADKTELSNATAAVATRVKAIEDDYLTSTDKTELANSIKAVSDDYLKSSDKTELANRITNEAPVTIQETAGTGDILKTYTFTQNGKTIGTINLAKDLVVSSGDVKLHDGVKCLELTLTSGDIVHIPVSDLVDVYTAGNYITIGTDNKISVNKDEIIAGLATTESVNTAIANEVTRANAAYDAKGDAGKAQTAAEAKAAELATAAETAAKSYADGLAKNYDAAGDAANALKDAKAYADGLASNYATAAQGAKADAAAPANTVYTKTEVDTFWAWEEL